MKTPEDAVTLLNELLKADPEALSLLIDHRVRCNVAVTEHPTIQCTGFSGDGAAGRVGLLGVLNGIFGVDENGRGYIALIEDDEDGEILGFKVLK